MKTHYPVCTSTLLVFFILLFNFNVSGQPLKKYDKINDQTFYINTKDSIVRFQASSDGKPKKYDSKLIYYWYKSNTVMKTVGGADGRLLSGEYICFYPDNNLREKGSFKKGLKNGIWTKWYKNGGIQEQESWKNGLKNGLSASYDINGEVTSSSIYKNGVIQKEKLKTAPVTKIPVKKADKEIPDSPAPKKSKG